MLLTDEMMAAFVDEVRAAAKVAASGDLPRNFHERYISVEAQLMWIRGGVNFFADVVIYHREKPIRARMVRWFAFDFDKDEEVKFGNSDAAPRHFVYTDIERKRKQYKRRER